MIENLPENITSIIVTALVTVCIYFIKKILDKFDKLTDDVRQLSQQLAILNTKFELELKSVRDLIKREKEEHG